MLEIKKVVVSVLLLVVSTAQAQLSPPGVSGAKVAAWGAIGFNQKLSKKWSLTVYAGGSRQSDPDNTHLLHKASIFVLNQETLYSFSQRWQLAFCNSIRIQEIYSEEKPYALEHPGVRNELRYYLRLFYRHNLNRVSMSYSFRPEYRTFYASSWNKWITPVELRFRIKGQANIPLNESRNNQIIIANELLTAIDHYSSAAADRWSTYRFTENRLANYFRHVFQKPALSVDVGMMHQFWKEKLSNKFHYTAYLSFDLLFSNPFGKRTSS